MIEVAVVGMLKLTDEDLSMAEGDLAQAAQNVLGGMGFVTVSAAQLERHEVEVSP